MAKAVHYSDEAIKKLSEPIKDQTLLYELPPKLVSSLKKAEKMAEKIDRAGLTDRRVDQLVAELKKTKIGRKILDGADDFAKEQPEMWNGAIWGDLQDVLRRGEKELKTRGWLKLI